MAAIVYRRFLAQAEYVESFTKKGETVPPFLVFQPYEIRNGIPGYMVPCSPDHSEAEVFPALPIARNEGGVEFFANVLFQAMDAIEGSHNVAEKS